VLLPFRGLGYVEGGSSHLPWLAELPMGARDPWRQCVELAPKDASKHGIGDGDEVIVESPHGRLAMQAHVHDGMRPGVLGLPLGDGDAPVGLLGGLADETGQWLAFTTRARIGRVE
jgi:anaerobic selenocysteine-containing dehydrogenase